MRLALLAAMLTSACSSPTTAEPSTSEQDAVAPPPSSSEEGGATGPSDGGTSEAGKETSSHGSGGLSCTKTEDLGGGRKACVAKLGSIEIKVAEPSTGSGPLRLGMYVHGDGAGAHKSGSALKAMLSWMDEKHGLGVSVLAPNGCAWWQEPSYDCSGAANAPDTTAENSKLLLSALESLYQAYDIRLDGIAYYGSSGGSIFLTEQWLPLHGHQYFGVFALMCGGRVPAQPFAWDTGDKALVARMPLFFTYGDQDAVIGPEVEQAIPAFQDKGFKVTTKAIPGAGHCAFDGHGEAVGIWQQSF
jgi:predicted esterase